MGGAGTGNDPMPPFKGMTLNWISWKGLCVLNPQNLRARRVSRVIESRSVIIPSNPHRFKLKLIYIGEQTSVCALRAGEP